MNRKWADTTGVTLDRPCREQLRHLPPSAGVVARILATDGPLSPEAVAEAAMLSEETVRYALNRLSEAGLVARSPTDPRYALCGCAEARSPPVREPSAAEA